MSTQRQPGLESHEAIRNCTIRKAHDEARTLLREIYSSPADLQIVGTQLHVRINALSAPRRSRALAGLCAELTETETTYPGTNLVLVYTVKGH